jgi:hypothetical protein
MRPALPMIPILAIVPLSWRALTLSIKFPKANLYRQISTGRTMRVNAGTCPMRPE